jgi:uncharacterized protein
MKRMTSFIFIVVAIYVGSTAFLFLFQRSFMYHPSAGHLDPALFDVPEMALVKIETDDGLSLAAWYRAPKTPEVPTLLYFHGNAGHIGDRADKVKPYLDQGFGVLLLSYRGFGTNHGYPTEQNLYLDGQAALKFLAEMRIPIFRTVIYGESLGTGVAVEMARNKAISALVLEAPFSSMMAAASRHFKFFPVRFLVRDKYDSISKINEIKAPVLILHGVRDKTVPFDLGRKLYEAAPTPKKFYDFPEAGHNNLYEHGAAERVIQFLESNS